LVTKKVGRRSHPTRDSTITSAWRFSQKGDKTEAIGEPRIALTLDPSPQDREKIRQLLAALQR
jgi:hypothetical protein